MDTNDEMLMLLLPEQLSIHNLFSDQTFLNSPQIEISIDIKQTTALTCLLFKAEVCVSWYIIF